MIKKCRGCGIILQDNNILLEGYTTDMRNDFCQRCFKLKNYGEYEFVTKSNEEYIGLLKNIGRKKSLVLYVVDLLSIPSDLTKIKDYLKHNDIILVLNKRDVLPLSINEQKIIEYIKALNINFINIIIISAEKNYNLDNLMKMISKYRNSPNVYVVGNTNAGKSTLINKIINNYSVETGLITISAMPSTTLSEIKIAFKDYFIIDTPGLVDDGNILNFVDSKNIKKISPHKEIKPRIFQLKKGQSLIVSNFLRIDYLEGERNSFTLFISNDIDVKRIVSKKHNYLKDLPLQEKYIRFNNDLVINGLGFIKIIFEGQINLYINKDIEVFTRKSLI